jgi:hypothetical protein
MAHHFLPFPYIHLHHRDVMAVIQFELLMLSTVIMHICIIKIEDISLTRMCTLTGSLLVIWFS